MKVQMAEQNRAERIALKAVSAPGMMTLLFDDETGSLKDSFNS